MTDGQHSGRDRYVPCLASPYPPPKHAACRFLDGLGMFAWMGQCTVSSGTRRSLVRRKLFRKVSR